MGAELIQLVEKRRRQLEPFQVLRGIAGGVVTVAIAYPCQALVRCPAYRFGDQPMTANQGFSHFFHTPPGEQFFQILEN